MSTLKEFEVEPLTRYCLSFNAAEKVGDNATWELQIFNKEGLLPYEGVFAYNWQKIVLMKTRVPNKNLFF